MDPDNAKDAGSTVGEVLRIRVGSPDVLGAADAVGLWLGAPDGDIDWEGGDEGAGVTQGQSSWVGSHSLMGDQIGSLHLSLLQEVLGFPEVGP
mmetsp:Transcript_13474/g.39347  ORF Transcript_13474/g.39347 Transcript_13474/m.39347 type:complete len:93 (-) Transcript_13474:676-954(-)|eukprot:CAMPEP_0113559260 /NCGR_PEP_ID=MMETSP0015_2-20120614/18795_1 /TAXON_ID=2838 /ORGANISM="Odontella" /LENGTH=92 /DNA_ID=CAMNT_0000460871 /DNA_START=709 /DNA_END=987 /DNA_ORIENTATION=+ /assembly_acc=CAM_ASM_000160